MHNLFHHGACVIVWFGVIFVILINILMRDINA